MTAALTPDLALAYIRELSADVLDGIVLGADGSRLAGNPALHTPAQAFLEAGGEGATARGKAFAVRGERHSIVVVTGPFALPRVVARDVRAAVTALGGESAQETPLGRVPDVLTEALLTAAQDIFRRHSAVSRSD
jgi:hypothetical protein